MVKIIFFVLLVLIWKQKHMKEEIDFFTSTCIFFKSSKIFFLLGMKGRGGGGACSERDVTQVGSRKQTWQIVKL